VLGVGSAVLLVAVGLPLWQPLLLAAVLAGALEESHERLARAVGARRSLSAALLTVGVVLVVLVPLWLLAVLLFKEVSHLIASVRHIIAQQGLPGLLQPLPAWLRRWADPALARWSRSPHGPLHELINSSHAPRALGAAAGAVGSIGHLLLMAALMLVAMFFLLRDGPSLISWAEATSALPEGRLRSLLAGLRDVSRSVLGAQLGSGLAQAAVATAGFALSGVPAPLLFGVLALALSLLPIGGVALIGVPLAVLLALTGHTGWGIFLAALTTVGTGLIDDILRPMIVGGKTHLHGALVLFSLLGGLLAFGPIGLVVGPLALALFLTVSDARRRDDMSTTIRSS
jgi:predicted PurR-regulated permease PerM